MEARIDGWMDTEGEKLSFFSVHNPSNSNTTVRTKPGSFKETGSAPKSKPQRCLYLAEEAASFPQETNLPSSPSG